MRAYEGEKDAMNPSHPLIVLGPSEGRSVAAGGVEIRVKAEGAQTDGAYFCMEYHAPPGWLGPPRHYHERTDEMFYVLDGEITVFADEEEHRAVQGSFVHVPRGTVHTFANYGAQSALYLIMTFPAGFEGYLREVPALVEEHGYPPPRDLVAEIESKYDIHTVGPQPERREPQQ
jgi:quercetin dioxygenase-like cupin family protein